MAQPFVVRIENRLELWGEPGPQELSEFKGFAIDPEGFEGIDDGVDMRREFVARPQAHGDFEVPGFLAARPGGLSGWCRADSHAQLLHFRSILTGVLGHGATGSFVVQRADGVLWGRAGRAAAPRFKVRARTPRVADWQLQLWFPDPRLFGDTQVFPNADYSLAQVSHRGNFSAAPVLTVSGASPSGYTIAGPDGRLFVVTRALVAGVPHVIDMRTGYLSIAGVVVIGGVTAAQTWAVPPGATVAMSVAPVSGTAVLTVGVTDTYV